MPQVPQIQWIDTSKRSSNIARVGRDQRASTLTIEFKSRGTYQYSNVSNRDYHTFMSQPSLGHSYNKMFYGKPKLYPSQKLAQTSGH
jgi:hypothetical protein